MGPYLSLLHPLISYLLLTLSLPPTLLSLPPYLSPSLPPFFSLPPLSSSSSLIPPPPFSHSFYPPSNPFSQTLSKSCSSPISVTCLEPGKKDLSLIKTHVKF